MSIDNGKLLHIGGSLVYDPQDGNKLVYFVDYDEPPVEDDPDDPDNPEPDPEDPPGYEWDWGVPYGAWGERKNSGVHTAQIVHDPPIYDPDERPWPAVPYTPAHNAMRGADWGSGSNPRIQLMNYSISSQTWRELSLGSGYEHQWWPGASVYGVAGVKITVSYSSGTNFYQSLRVGCDWSSSWNNSWSWATYGDRMFTLPQSAGTHTYTFSPVLFSTPISGFYTKFFFHDFRPPNDVPGHKYCTPSCSARYLIKHQTS